MMWSQTYATDAPALAVIHCLDLLSLRSLSHFPNRKTDARIRTASCV
jgi:hypothetical protein